MLKHLIIHTIFATLTLATPCLALPRISHKERENWGQKLPKSILHKYSGS